MKKLMSMSMLMMLGMLVISSVAFAATSPVPTLQTTADKIIAELQKNRADLHNNPQISYRIVTTYLVPMVDQANMAQQVLGRAAWQKATSAQQQEFTQQFKTLVVRTYAAAIAEFTNEKVQFMPLRKGMENNPLVDVNTRILRVGKPAINVNYRMHLVGSNWKLVDFSVDGISMIESFRAQFNSVIAQSGVGGLNQRLLAHNKKNQ